MYRYQHRSRRTDEGAIATKLCAAVRSGKVDRDIRPFSSFRPQPCRLSAFITSRASPARPMPRTRQGSCYRRSEPMQLSTRPGHCWLEIAARKPAMRRPALWAIGSSFNRQRSAIVVVEGSADRAPFSSRDGAGIRNPSQKLRQNQHARVACAACSFPTANGITRLMAPSTWSLDAPSVLIARVSIKPSWSPPLCSRSASRDFVHWRFSYACRRRARIGSSCRRPKTYTRAVELGSNSAGL
jgi:hypothetical protein